MRKIFILAALLMVVFAHAQKNFQPATVVTNDKRSLAGFINYKEWVKNPQQIEFSLTGTEKDIQVLGFDDILSFEVTGAEHFERYSCRISMDAVNLNYLSVGKDSSWREQKVFLKLLVGGNINLYSYQDDLKERYYIKKAGMLEPEELVYRRYYDMDNNSVMNEEKEYINQLLSAGSPITQQVSLSKRINDSRYREEELSSIVKMINNNGMVIKKEKQQGRTQFIAGVGVHYSDFEFQGSRGYLPASEYSFSSSVSPLFFGGVNVYVNPRTAKLFLRTDASFFFNSYIGKANPVTPEYRYEYKYILKYSAFAVFIGPMFNFIRQKDLNAYIGLGPGVQFSSMSANKEHETRSAIYIPNDVTEKDLTPPVFDKTWVSYSFRIGVGIKKLDISGSFCGLRGKQVNTFGFNSNSNYAQLRVGYLLGKAKP